MDAKLFFDCLRESGFDEPNPLDKGHLTNGCAAGITVDAAISDEAVIQP